MGLDLEFNRALVEQIASIAGPILIAAAAMAVLVLFACRRL